MTDDTVSRPRWSADGQGIAAMLDDPFGHPGAARLALGQGPWAWLAHPRALALVPSGPPATGPRTPLLTVESARAEVWVEPVGSSMSSACCELGPAAAESWSRAVDLVPRSLPVQLVGATFDAARPCVIRLAGLERSQGARSVRAAVIDGPSFGLSFGLMVAARALGAELPADGVASACLGGAGGLGEVEGVEGKSAVIQAWLPSVRRVWVARGQVGAWRTALATADRTIEVVGFGSLGEAIAALLGPSVEERLRALGADAPGRQRTLKTWYLLALHGARVPASWMGLMRAADRAAELWPAPEPGVAWRFAFARAVFARHAGWSVPMPDPGGIHHLPAAHRPLALAHIVQHHCDTGGPDRAVLDALLATFDGDAALRHPRVLGARGRLTDRDGECVKALGEQEAAVAAWFDRAPREASYALTEGLRLAGVTSDAGACARLEEAHAILEQLGVLEPSDCAFIEIARAVARLRIFGPEDAWAGARLTRAWTCPSVHTPSHLRFSAARHDAARLRSKGGVGARDAVTHLQSVADSEGRDDAEQARAYLALVDLDETVAQGDASGANAAVASLRVLARSTVEPVLARAPNDAVARAAFLALHYPY